MNGKRAIRLFTNLLDKKNTTTQKKNKKKNLTSMQRTCIERMYDD